MMNAEEKKAMTQMVRGKVFVFGDNVDTDQIYPGKYVEYTEIEDIRKYAMSGSAMPDLVKRFHPGDILVAGRNFGCGSSREHAPVAIKASGIPVVIAASFARIFYRNGINIGLPLLEIGSDVEKIKAGDKLRVDTATGTIEDLTTGDVFHAHPLPGFVQDIAKAGGLINYIKGQKD